MKFARKMARRDAIPKPKVRVLKHFDDPIEVLVARSKHMHKVSQHNDGASNSSVDTAPHDAPGAMG